MANMRLLFCVMLLLGSTSPVVAAPKHRYYFPLLHKPVPCAPPLGESYGTVPRQGAPYKDNRISDANPDFRLSVLGYQPNDAVLNTVAYGGASDLAAPRFRAVFNPPRLPTFASAAQRFNWEWNEAGPPPYGQRTTLAADFPLAVLGLASTPGEALRIGGRGTVINGSGEIAMVLFASENELTVVYGRADTVASGYVLHMLDLCVEPALVALYRAQLDGSGRRATARLPGVKNGQAVARAGDKPVLIAIRDSARFMDPRSLNDWWQP